MDKKRTPTEVGKRDYAVDNIRFFLIFTVVFAHLLEVCAPFAGRWQIYKLIYTFHMPVFIFLFGYHVRFSAKRIVFRWCIPYVIFHAVYTIFAVRVLREPVAHPLTRPYWLLWYMMACVFYQVLLPLYDTTDRRRQILALVCVYALSLIVGFVDSIGYYLSLSRFFAFQPWFLLGYYCKKNGILEKLSVPGGKGAALVWVSAAVILLSIPFACNGKLPKELLYGSYSYASCAGALWMRAVAWVISLGWILFLFVGVRPRWNRKLPLVTAIGQNTWPIFLFHGFLVKLVQLRWPELVATPGRTVLLACGILLLLGNRVCSRAMDYPSFSWLEKWPCHRDGA